MPWVGWYPSQFAKITEDALQFGPSGTTIPRYGWLMETRLGTYIEHVPAAVAVCAGMTMTPAKPKLTATTPDFTRLNTPFASCPVWENARADAARQSASNAHRIAPPLGRCQSSGWRLPVVVARTISLGREGDRSRRPG